MENIQKILFTICLFLLISNIGQGLSIDDKKSDLSILNESKIEIIDGVKILYLNGSYYDMGYQHGFLLKNEIQENMRAFTKFSEEIASYETLLNMWNETEPYIPSFYIEEMQGICDGADVSFEQVAALYMIVLFMDMKCFTYAAWSNATIDGNLYHIRSLDFPLNIKDPISGKYIQENSIIIVRNPENGLKSLAPSIAGGINFYQGINEKNVTIGVQVCWSDDQTLKGMPVIFKIQKILDTAETADEAINILVSNRTLGWNFIVTDGKENTGYIVEITANQTYIGKWNDPVENSNPFWQIENVVRRTNFFIHPILADTQRPFYKPSGIRGFLRLFTGGSFFLLWRKYRAMSNEIERNWGDIYLNSSINLMRRVYSGKTDFFMFIFPFLGKDTILCDFHQWAVCPEIGDFVISFADAKRYSHEAELHYFDLNSLFLT